MRVNEKQTTILRAIAKQRKIDKNCMLIYGKSESFFKYVIVLH